MSDIRKKIEKVAVDDNSGWLKEAKYRRDNRAWLRKSQSIALRILDVLEEKGVQQKELAEAMNVSPQQISKIVKGKQNLTLETITKMETVLGVPLMEVAKHQQSVSIEKKEVEPNMRKRREPKVVAHIDLGRFYNQNWSPSDNEASFKQTA
ncbi:MAG: helix-turn-helix domain-containing protein [Balneola sp.]